VNSLYIFISVIGLLRSPLLTCTYQFTFELYLVSLDQRLEPRYARHSVPTFIWWPGRAEHPGICGCCRLSMG